MALIVGAVLLAAVLACLAFCAYCFNAAFEFIKDARENGDKTDFILGVFLGAMGALFGLGVLAGLIALLQAVA